MFTESTETSIAAYRRNLILARMPEAQCEELARHMVPVTFALGMRLGLPNQPHRYLHFPVSGLISFDALTESGASVEVGVAAREGLVGVAGLLGQPQMPHSNLVQAPGAGFRVPMPVMRELFLRGGIFTELVHQHIYLQMVQMAQSALCNRLHPLECRMARWMLTASDRMEQDQLILTQEFLAQMLGSRRSTVTVAAGRMQDAGLIEYARGKVRILDRARLETTACECYGMVKAVYQRVLGNY